jgi:predicted transporter
MAVAFYTSAMTYNASVAAQRAIPIPFQMEWYTLLIIGLIPTFLISIGIYYQKEWSRIECLVWGLAAYLTAPASFVVFRVFSSLGFPLNV